MEKQNHNGTKCMKKILTSSALLAILASSPIVGATSVNQDLDQAHELRHEILTAGFNIKSKLTSWKFWKKDKSETQRQKSTEGKCGNPKTTEGKCGEGKCDESRCGGSSKVSEDKCGESKCCS